MGDVSAPEERRRQFVEAREASGLTQEQAAKALGMSLASVSRKERGEQPVSSGDLIAMKAIASADGASRGLGTVPRGTVREEARHAWLYAALGRLEGRMDAFEREMVRLGADDFEADHVREGAQAFLESLEPHQDLNPDEELELYLEAALRSWVLQRIERRNPPAPIEDPAEDLVLPEPPAGPETNVTPINERASAFRGRRRK